MKLSLLSLLPLPPLMILCSDLLFQKPSSLAALPLAPTTYLEQSAQVISVGRPYNIITHPSTGSCVLRKSLSDPLKLGPCDQSDAWSYTPQKFLVVKGTYFCLQAVDPDKPAKLGIICTESNSRWEVIPNSKTHLSTKLADGTSVCLDVDPNNTLITNPCLCLSSGGVCESDSQWFEITTRSKDQNLDENRPVAANSFSDLP